MYQMHVLVGNLGRDPIMQYTEQGLAFTKFSLAVNRGTGDNRTTIWWDITTFGKQAETCHEYLRKGSRVIVSGDRMEVGIYTAKDGTPKVDLGLIADTVRFLGGDELAEKEEATVPF